MFAIVVFCRNLSWLRSGASEMFWDRGELWRGGMLRVRLASLFIYALLGLMGGFVGDF